MYYERRRAEAVWTAGRDRDVFRGLGFENKLNTHNCVCVLLLQDLLQRCSRGGWRRVADMCYERRRTEACVHESARGGARNGPRRRQHHP